MSLWAQQGVMEMHHDLVLVQHAGGLAGRDLYSSDSRSSSGRWSTKSIFSDVVIVALKEVCAYRAIFLLHEKVSVQHLGRFAVRSFFKIRASEQVRLWPFCSAEKQLFNARKLRPGPPSGRTSARPPAERFICNQNKLINITL